jgi:hypothetical protein
MDKRRKVAIDAGKAVYAAIISIGPFLHLKW